MGNRHATTAELIRIHELLVEALVKDENGQVKVDDAGRVTFLPGRSDLEIAAKVSPELKNHHVARIRAEVFGSLFVMGNPREPTRLDSVRERVGRVEQRVDQCVTAIDSVSRRAHTDHMEVWEIAKRAEKGLAQMVDWRHHVSNPLTARVTELEKSTKYASRIAECERQVERLRNVVDHLLQDLDPILPKGT